MFNNDTVFSVNARWPEIGIAGIDQPVAFGSPTSLFAPRRVTLGARWQF